MKLKTIAATLFATLLVSPAFAVPATGITECDQLFKVMVTCVMPMAESAEDKQQLDELVNGMATQIKEMVEDGSVSKADAVENCNIAKEQMREEGCK